MTRTLSRAPLDESESVFAGEPATLALRTSSGASASRRLAEAKAAGLPSRILHDFRRPHDRVDLQAVRDGGRRDIAGGLRKIAAFQILVGYVAEGRRIRRREETMTIEVTRRFLLWCTVINYGVLLVWFLAFVFAHDLIQRIHTRWFQLSRDQFDALHYAGMSIFKIEIILFNLVPLVVLSVLS